VRDVHIERVSIVSHQPFGVVLAGIEAAIGHPDMQEFRRKLAGLQTEVELSRIVESAILSLFISRTTPLPNSVRSLCFGVSVAESAQLVFRL
jgi:hypothetical protein